MGESVKIDEVIDKMEKVFRNILPSEAVLQHFYSTKQLAAESVAVWACRLEDILSKLKTTLFSKDVTKSMLRTKFYSGLRPGSLKNALRHSFDGGSNYDDLLVAARVAELEEEQEKASRRCRCVRSKDLHRPSHRISNVPDRSLVTATGAGRLDI